jgi:hypothetical protein
LKIAYLILGHAFPERIVGLIEQLRPCANAFVVHIDARAERSVFPRLTEYASGVDDVYLAPRKRCYWGRYGIVDATFGCMRMLLETGCAFDYAVLLSGQDYPIKSCAEIAAHFREHPRSEFIEAFPLAQPNRWTCQTGMFQAMARVEYWTLNFRSRTMQLRLKRKFYMGWEPHGGSQWWALTREAIEWIDGYRRANPALERYFRFVLIPDESMLQTMVANSPFRGRIAAQPLHYVDWDRPNPEAPRTLVDEDFEPLRLSSCLFARKMHPERSAALIARIGRELLEPRKLRAG